MIQHKTVSVLPHLKVGLGCSLCSFTTMSLIKRIAARELTKHKSKIHYICKVCETKCETRKALGLHIDVVHKMDDHSLKCSVDGCTKTASPQVLQRHIQSIHRDVWYKCDDIGVVNGESFTCDKRYSDKTELRIPKEKGHFKLKPKEIKKKRQN